MRAFTCWLVGPALETRTAFALELAARLRHRELAVEWLGDDVACGIHDLDGRPDLSRTEYLCSLLVRHHVIPLIPESALSDAARRALCRRLDPIVVVHIEAPGSYEPPSTADYHFRMGRESVAEAVVTLLLLLEHRDLIRPTHSDLDRDEALLTKRLADLGYL